LSGAPGRGLSLTAGRKTAEAIRQEVAREVDQLLRVIFRGRRKTGRLDLEAIEMAVRSAMHQAGAAALTELLQFPAPAADQRSLPCCCGRQAHYRELRSKPVLTAVGKVGVSRPYYVCSHCHTGQFPADVELDIEGTEFSAGVRRMHAVVGEPVPILYVQMDGMGVYVARPICIGVSAKRGGGSGTLQPTQRVLRAPISRRDSRIGRPVFGSGGLAVTASFAAARG
jgi:hypothetical protein